MACVILYTRGEESTPKRARETASGRLPKKMFSLKGKRVRLQTAAHNRGEVLPLGTLTNGNGMLRQTPFNKILT